MGCGASKGAVDATKIKKDVANGDVSQSTGAKSIIKSAFLAANSRFFGNAVRRWSSSCRYIFPSKVISDRSLQCL